MNIDDTQLRFSGAPWFPFMQTLTVTIGGLGGIGSNAAEAIACLGVKTMVLIDPQLVEAVNLAGQNFTMNDVGQNKVVATANRINLIAPNVSVVANPVLITDKTLLSRITFCCFDNMEARRVACTNWYRRNKDNPKSLLVDGRVGPETLQVFAFRGCDTASVEQYFKEGLFSSEEAEQTVCSYKQTRYLTQMIGSFMADTLVAYVMKTNVSKYVQIPYYREYDSPSQHYVWKPQPK